MFKIVNHKGIKGTLSYAVWERSHNVRNFVYAADCIGGETTVKAVFATVFGRSGRLNIRTRRHKPGQVYVDPALNYKCKKQVLTQNPTLFHYHFYALPNADRPYFVFYNFVSELVVDEETQETNAEAVKLSAFQAMMEKYTVWPMLKPWAKPLFKRGQDLGYGLVVPLQHTANIAYAYKVRTSGWDEALASLRKEDQLPLPAAED